MKDLPGQPVPLQGGTHSPAQHPNLHRNTFPLQTVQSCCLLRRFPLQERFSPHSGQHQRHKRSSGRVLPCCARSSWPRQLQPTRTLASRPWPRLVSRQSACWTGTRARRRAAAAPPAPSSWPRRRSAAARTIAAPTGKEIRLLQLQRLLLQPAQAEAEQQRRLLFIRPTTLPAPRARLFLLHRLRLHLSPPLLRFDHR
jgi:hypothetical protein